MLSVKDAQSNILNNIETMPAEQIPLTEAVGRVLAEDLSARRTQPPMDVSAMDGYAVKHTDIQSVPTTLSVAGEAPAGGSYNAEVKSGEAIRIFTGGPVPKGADCIVIQENTEREGEQVTILQSEPEGRFIRPAGLDFAEGDILLQKGRLLTARDVALAAAMNRPWIMVHKKPTVAILATGDEVVMPGDPVGPNQVVSSNSLGLAAAIKTLGGKPILLGVAKDTPESLKNMAAGAASADLLITTGGASVGDHDLIRSVLGKNGLDINFYKIAMRPGKPLIFGQLNGTPMLGLPGNPVSTLVCSVMFVAPALAKMLGLHAEIFHSKKIAKIGCDLDENDQREDYLRSVVDVGDNGELIATPYSKQDSAMLAKLAKAQALVIRPPFAKAIKKGDMVEVLELPNSLLSL
ncbi:gephyrin-like molybdotransferase Glp [Curvivirga sp.]|uniref:molybdopterin molybdotransferase MoeA n=1 Tax=Curvivirga sp. TaxID=2856848 RepID=UPI003B596456